MVRSIESLKRAVAVKGMAIYDIETLFSRLLDLGQQRSVDLSNIFQFKLNPVPTSLNNEYGCLRKGNKAVLVKSLGVSVKTPPAPEVELVNAGQLLYHVVWPDAGTADLAASFGARLAHYLPSGSKKIVLFDRYDQEAPSAREHEQMRRGRAKEVRLTPKTPLPCRQAILHNATNKSAQQYPIRLLILHSAKNKSAQQYPIQLLPSTQHPAYQQARLCRHPC